MEGVSGKVSSLEPSSCGQGTRNPRLQAQFLSQISPLGPRPTTWPQNPTLSGKTGPPLSKLVMEGHGFFSVNTTLSVTELPARGAWKPQTNSPHKLGNIDPITFSIFGHLALGFTHLLAVGMAPHL